MSVTERPDKSKINKWVSLYCTVGCKWVTEMDSVKFEFNDIISYIIL